MAYQIDAEQLRNEVSEFIDSDPMTALFDDGSFEWHYATVTYRKLPNSVLLEVDGVVFEASRP